MRIGSLFSGIGGLELGLERAGLGPVLWQCERDPFARKVLEKHWPHAHRYDDVTTMESPPYVDIICGGFPCQDVSVAGFGAGLDGGRSGLWREFVRIIRVVRPRYVVVENVTALLARGLGRVLGDLAESGYDAEWDCLPAVSVGAPHERDRVFLVAYPNGVMGCVRDRVRHDGRRTTAWPPTVFAGHHAPDLATAWGDEAPQAGDRGVDDGLPARVDRLRTLGNAVVPQVGEVIGRAIVAAEGAA